MIFLKTCRGGCSTFLFSLEQCLQSFSQTAYSPTTFANKLGEHISSLKGKTQGKLRPTSLHCSLPFVKLIALSPSPFLSSLLLSHLDFDSRTVRVYCSERF